MHSPFNIIVAATGINLLTLLLFWWDKRCARKGGWRVSEGALLLCCALGGSITGYFAMRVLRHKTSKASFRIRFWMIVVAQMLVIVWLQLR